MSRRSRIVVDPEVMTGKPVVEGTRLTVEFLLELLAEGWSQEEILRNHPSSTKEDLESVLRFAADVVSRSDAKG